jgi:processive 1,2-diacylglycerol beta-glucosyltransferase
MSTRPAVGTVTSLPEATRQPATGATPPGPPPTTAQAAALGLPPTPGQATPFGPELGGAEAAALAPPHGGAKATPPGGAADWPLAARPHGPRVLILSADIGDGHNTAARALAAQLRERGAVVEVDERMQALSASQRVVLRDASRVLFRYAPRLFSAYYGLLMHSRIVRGNARRSLIRVGRRPMLRLIARHRPDLIVSTYPPTTVVLGALRRSGEVSVPAVATVTDLAGLFFWAAPGIDRHLVSWAASAAEVRALAPDSDVRHVAPLTHEAFHHPCDGSAARRALDLPPDRPIVVVSGGGWGVGDLTGAVRSALRVPDAFVVAVSGRSKHAHAALTRAVAASPDVRVLGFTDRMSDLLAAADVLVHSTGGVTCLEAGLRGCPVVLYGFPVGHVRHNALAMERLGLVQRAPTAADLPAAIARARATPPPPPEPLPCAAQLTLATAPQHLTPARKPLRPRAAAAMALVAVLAIAGLAQTTPGDAVADHVHLPHRHATR